MRCGVCGGGFVIQQGRYRLRERPQQRHLRQPATMRRDALETTVSGGLAAPPDGPGADNDFCKEYARAMNRLRGEHNAHREAVAGALGKTERELDRLVQALMDGVPASAVKDKMADLEARQGRVARPPRRERGHEHSSPSEHGRLLPRRRSPTCARR